MNLSVCVFGDSVSKGVVFDSVLKKYTLLRDCFANLIKSSFPVIIKNYSKFGCTITKGMEMLCRHQNELSGYDYTVLEFGGNDCDYNWAEVSSEPEQNHNPKTPVYVFEQKYEELIARIKQCGSHPVLLTLPPIDAKRYFAWISKGLNPRAILNWLGDIDHIYRWHERYNLAVCQVARECQVPLIDISSAFLETHQYQSLLCEDGIHPNEEGHRLISNVIGSTIEHLQTAMA
ncbi:MAG: SGNH/GDSL hydrolase family protein [Oscillospiraceae bacterium]|jgi:lysophospholipase L1-like esterase|nr:SGNH/GDSL hydrolase family protein [Oscillospiraceae bacterium]